MPTTTPFRAIEPRHFPWLDYRRYTYSLGLERDGTAVLSGTVASVHDAGTGRVGVEGDTATQVTTTWVKIDAVLHAAGLSGHDVRRVVQYVRADRFAEFASARAFLPAAVPETATVSVVPVTRLLRDAAHVEIEVVASRPADSAGDDAGDPFRGILSLPAVSVPCPTAGELSGAWTVAWDRLGQLLAERSLALSQLVQLRCVLVGHPVGDHTSLPDEVGPAVAVVSVPQTSDGFRGVRIDSVASSDPVSVVFRDGGVSALTTGRLMYAAGPGVGDDLREATRTVYRALLEPVARHGGQVLKTVEFVPVSRLDGYRETANVRRELLSEPWPAATGLVCEGLSPTGTALWVEAVAYLPESAAS